MLKTACTPHPFKPYKCGEIFCVSQPAVFHVTCFLCDEKIGFAQFIEHFQAHHDEQSISLIEIDELLIKEDPDDDPIKQEDIEEPIFEQERYDLPLSDESGGANCEENEPVDDEDSEIDKMEMDLETANISTNIEIEIVNESQSDLNPVSQNEDEEDNNEDEWEDNNLQENDTNSKYDDKTNLILNGSEYYCDICQRSYASRKSLQGHTNKFHMGSTLWRNPILQCNEAGCTQKFRTERELLAHRVKHTGIFCDICGQTFTEAGNMRRHKIRHSGIKEHKCEECSKEFYTAKELKAHMICHTGLPIVCEVCGKRFRNTSFLSAHMRRHNNDRPAKCEVCGKAFYAYHDLKIHSVTHTRERPFPCDVCKSRFQTKKSLRVHKRIHSKDRNRHICKVCGKSFAHISGLKSHIRTHDAAGENLITRNPYISNNDNYFEI